ncbi:ABC transporter substrate-binding protein [Butyrivibrio sp. FCS014]|uniref:ABC transporter substrate-binding protein n=1 Tax=Butyrivibrio sp. FCS014 TaxID=1408304 RepID=UPI000465607F|nr:extracellular solute-binding protein [Butyrivibrio sp. FCS014]
MRGRKLKNIFVSFFTIAAVLTSTFCGPAHEGTSRCFAAQEEGEEPETPSFEAAPKVILPEDEHITIRIATWYDEYNLQHLKAYLANEFPNYDFEFVFIGKSNYEPIMDDQLSFKGAPDILYVDQEMTRKHAITGYFADLTDETEQFSSEAKVMFGYGNRVYAVPNTSQYTCIFYNKKIFEKYALNIPTDLDSFISTCDYIRLVKGMKPLSISLKNMYDVSDLFLGVIAASYLTTDRGSGFGGRLQYGRTTFTDEFGEYLDDWNKLISHNVLDKKMYTMDKQNAIEEFAGEECAMICGGPDTYNAITRMNPDIEVGTMPFFGSRGKKRAIIGGCDCGFAVNKNSLHLDQAKEVVGALGSYSGQTALWEDRPGSQTYLKDTAFINRENFDELEEMIESGQAFTPWMQWGDDLNREPRRRLGIELQKSLLGEQSVKAALRIVDTVVAEILEQS